MAAPSRFVAFLRAINVGGHVVTMDQLKKLFIAYGATNVETFIASGNVIFTASGKRPEVVERALEKHLNAALGYEVRTFIRTAAEVAAIAATVPFAPKTTPELRVVNVGFLTAPLAPPEVKTVMALTSEDDFFFTSAREVYWGCRTGQSESKYFTLPWQKVLKGPVTFRNMNTIRRIAAKYEF